MQGGPGDHTGAVVSLTDEMRGQGLLGEWGEWVVNDASCAARWSEFQDKGCSAPTVRTFASRLRDVPAGQTWEAA
jgi:hypothetical protein